MDFTEQQNQIKSRVRNAIRLSGIFQKKIEEDCPSINSKGYLSKLISPLSGKTIMQNHVEDIAKAIGIDFDLLWYGEEQISEQHIEFDSSYMRTPLHIDEFIEKHRKDENIDEHDEAFMRNLYSRGSKLEKVPEQSIMNMLKAFRRDAKEQWVKGKKDE